MSTHYWNNQQVWMPPPNGWFKLNVDTAIQIVDQKAGLRVVTRNSTSKIIAAAVHRVSFRGNVAFMEAEAVLYGIQAAQQAKCVPMVIESDSLEVVNLSLNRKGSMTKITWTIEYI